jgi:hypothetical protein
MKSTERNNDQSHEPEQAAAKAAILAEREAGRCGCDLRSGAFRWIRRGWNHRGTESYDSEWYAWGEHEPVNHGTSHLQQHFEALVPFGYENDRGGFGDVVLDVSPRKLTVDRFEDYTTTTYEV